MSWSLLTRGITDWPRKAGAGAEGDGGTYDGDPGTGGEGDVPVGCDIVTASQIWFDVPLQKVLNSQELNCLKTTKMSSSQVETPKTTLYLQTSTSGRWVRERLNVEFLPSEEWQQDFKDEHTSTHFPICSCIYPSKKNFEECLNSWKGTNNEYLEHLSLVVKTAPSSYS